MTSKISSEVKRSRGRPKGFERMDAVRAAMTLFWERGYEGTSFDDLTAVMGINASSFRNTFKTKEALYREATDLYVSETGAWFVGVLSKETDVRRAFARLLEETAALYTRDDLPSGCMISLAATHTAPAQATLRTMMLTHREEAETVMAERLKKGQMEGQLSADIDTETLAAFFNTVFRGMAVQARDGATRARLLEVAKLSMNAFPGGAITQHLQS